jgi:FKBP-type peptidyl-prolyl cis-trans isomerase FkpA
MRLVKLCAPVLSLMVVLGACSQSNNSFNQTAQNLVDDQLIRQYLIDNQISAIRDTVLSSTPGDTTYLYYRIDSLGSGNNIQLTDTLTVQYTGKLLNGTVFYQTTDTTNAAFVLNTTIPAWELALQKVTPGSIIDIYTPSVLAYGYYGDPPGIPSNAVLIFNVKILKDSPAQ